MEVISPLLSNNKYFSEKKEKEKRIPGIPQLWCSSSFTSPIMNSTVIYYLCRSHFLARSERHVRANHTCTYLSSIMLSNSIFRQKSRLSHCLLDPLLQHSLDYLILHFQIWKRNNVISRPALSSKRIVIIVRNLAV